MKEAEVGPKTVRATCLLLCIAEMVSFTPTASFAQGVSSRADNRAKRPVKVADSIQMTMLGDERYYYGYPLMNPVAKFSPDKSKFVLVTRRGSLEDNTNKYSLVLCRTNRVMGSRAPKTILTMSSSSNRAAIEDINWQSDSETVLFLGERPAELHQVYSFNVSTLVLRKLTNHPTNILRYSVSNDGRTIAYTAEKPVVSLFDESARRNGFIASTQSLWALLAGKIQASDNGQLFIQRIGQRSRLLRVSSGAPWGKAVPYLSPDGKYVAIVTRVAEIPENWKEYSDPHLKEWSQVKLRRGEYSYLMRYVLVNTQSDEETILLNAPTVPLSRALWLPDSQSIVLDGVYLPLDSSGTTEKRVRQATIFVVEIKIPSARTIEVIDQPMTLLEWNVRSHCLVLKTGHLATGVQGSSSACFRRHDGGWQRVLGEAADDAQLRIMVEEGISLPPKIYAFAPASGERKLLLDLNPQFKELLFGTVEEVHWKGSDGHAVNGGLYYPANYMPGTRYPLVIQTHGWNSDRFWIDGAFPTGYAAQALAGKGIMVLQADETYTDMDTINEVTREVGTLEGAVEYLSGRGLIDKRRVGLLGFSRTCLYVKYALTHSQFQFAAAAVTDGFSAGYFPYISHLIGDGNKEYATAIEGVNGGQPFGAGLKTWLERSPGFSVDRVQCPLRIMALNPSSLLGEWDWFAALRRLDKPAELVYIQDGAHVLQRPWDRMTSQQGNVDWFDFWLKDEEDADPAKSEQYARWRELRKLQRRDNPKPGD